MPAFRLSLKILLTTIVAIAALYYAIGTANVGGIHSSNWTDAQLIRDRCQFHLIQPEWVSGQPDVLMNWIMAEIRARMGLVAALWAGSLSILIWKFMKDRKGIRQTSRA